MLSKVLARRVISISVFLLLYLIPSAQAVDEENCLMCHGHRGISYIDENNNLRLLYISRPIYQNSPHGIFSCRQCHTDINEIPHTKVEKVDCLKECHLDKHFGRTVFSHAEVEELLVQSVHSPVDEKGNPKMFADDYPTCKTCHQDPLYRPLAFFKKIRAGISEKITNRCLVCHDDPVFVLKFYSHFTSRMQKGRSSKEVVMLCARCHEDANFLKRHNQPNVVHAYWETYHGKAVFFGDEMAPDCLDCHANFFGSVHSMYAKDDPRSAVHPENRADVCNNIDCHPQASKNLMEFKVHLLADRERHPAEYYVSLFFVVLTLSCFIPIMLAAILDAVRKIFPGNTRFEDHPRPPRPVVDGVDLGSPEPVVKTKKGRRFFRHLTLNQRWQHVFIMLPFAGLALTGMPMKYPHVTFMENFYYLLGGIEIAPVIHRVCAVLMAFAFLYHFIYIAVTYLYFYLIPLKRAGKINTSNIIKSILSLPMVPTLDDIKHIGAQNKYRLFITNIKPAASRFTLKEKFGYLAVFWGVPVIGLSGMILWGEEVFTNIFPGNFLNFCLIAHSDEALLAIIVIFLWHLYNTHLRMENFPMSMSWITGLKKEHEMTEEHYGYYLGVMEKEGYPPHAPETNKPGRMRLILQKTGVLLTLLLLLISTTYLSWLVLYTVFGFHMRTIGRIPEKYYLTKPMFLEELLLEGKGEKIFYRGFRIVKELEITDHFHNITMQVGPDMRSHCIKCHGDFPHGKTEQIRAYLNMHAFFLACETCHVRPDSPTEPFIYKWYEKESGKILSATPTLDTIDVDALGIKLVPGKAVGTTWHRFDSDEIGSFVETFLNKLVTNKLSSEQKKNALQRIHEHIAPTSITCQMCHQQKGSLISYNDIGYSLARIKHLSADDVLAVIKDYDRFIIPDFL